MASGVDREGIKEVLGLWAGQAEDAKFWLQVLTELKNRGVKEIYIVCIDGLKEFPKAIEAVFQEAEVQLCIVHQMRGRSTRPARWKMPSQRLCEFGEKWDKAYPQSARCSGGTGSI